MGVVAAVSFMQLVAPAVATVLKALFPRQRVSQQSSPSMLSLAPPGTSEAQPFSYAFLIALQLRSRLRISCIRLGDEVASPCS